MEEKKAKTVEMKANKNANVPHEEQHQKLSYEQLNNICTQLYQENQKLIQRIQQTDLSNMFRRMDYLFMVLKYSEAFNDEEFVGRCVEELKEAISPREMKEEETEKEKEG